MFDEDQADFFHGAVHGRAAAEDHGAGGWPPATPPAHRQPRRLRDGRGGETDKSLWEGCVNLIRLQMDVVLA